MNSELQEVPAYLQEGCFALGMKDPHKIRQILARLSAIKPAMNPGAETIPEALSGIRGWVTDTIALHKVNMARVSIAVWFSWKLCLWKPEHVTLDHFYTHGCGFSPAQGDRLRHHGEVLVALALAEIPQMPSEKQARAVRKLIPDHMVGDFFKKFYSTYDPSVHYSACATKMAAQRYVENKILEARKQRDGLVSNAESPAETGEGDRDEALLASLPARANRQTPESIFSALPSKTAGDVQKLLEIITPGMSMEEFVAHCIDGEFHRIRRNLDAPCPEQTPLLDGLSRLSPRHKEAVERLFLPKLEAFILHLVSRESRSLLKKAVGAELVENAATVAQPESALPRKNHEPQSARKSARRKKRDDVDLTPELPFGPDLHPAPSACKADEMPGIDVQQETLNTNQNPDHE